VGKMLEFGAKLSLKDNMSASIQKNLKLQKQFSEQIEKTNNSMKKLGKTKVNPVIKVKDMATKTLETVKSTLHTVGKTVAKPIVAVKDGATATLNGIKKTLSTLAKGVTIAVGVAGTGVSMLAGASISEGASLQQSIGGVETLFKGDAGTVKANADMAFKTAGLSANAYMEQVTSFSASLLQSLGGDTAKSAEMADMAIIDMADNANKFGTDMSMIQNAYQGFAKQNYTMLDNLKLGKEKENTEAQYKPCENGETLMLVA
jgi:phage-related protein